MADPSGVEHVRGYCGLCIARCGTVATVEDGFLSIEHDRVTVVSDSAALAG